MCAEPLLPVTERRLRNSERDRSRLTHSTSSLWIARPGEKSEDRARTPQIIPIIEMVGIRRIKIDRLLDKTQPQNTYVEVNITLWIVCNCCNMVNTEDTIFH